MTYKTAKQSTLSCRLSVQFVPSLHTYLQVCMYNYCLYSICSPLRTIWYHKSLSLPGALFYTRPDVKSHSLTSTSKEHTQLAFEGSKADNQRRPRYRFGEGRVADKQRSKTSTVQPVHGYSQCVTLRLPTLHNYGSTMVLHLMSRT